MMMTEAEMDGMGMPPKAKVIMYKVYVHYAVSDGQWKMLRSWYNKLDSLHWGLGATVEPDYVSNSIRRTYLIKGQWTQC